jgi:cytochrome P450
MTMALADSVMQFSRAPQQFLLDMAFTGPAARFRMNDETFLVLSDPTSIHAVLNGGFDDFEKGATVEIPRASWRDGIITVEGEGWTEQHAMFAPLFARRRVRQLESFIAQRVMRQIEIWAALPAGEPVDMLAAASRLAFDIVAIGLLGITDETLADGLFDTLGELERVETVRLNYLVKRFAAEAHGEFGRSSHAQAIERMDRLTAAVADERLARDNPGDDFLANLMETAAFAAFTPERKRAFLADQVVTLLAAGFVTTGESIFWGLYLLAKHRAAQQRARAEILANTAATSGAVPIDAPPFLAAAFNESQRLYPPVWFMGRVARRDVRVGDVEIAAGTRVICSPYVLHRMPALWPDSDQYRPERFLPGAIPAVTPRSLIPFGSGMRACLGRGLALMEMCAIGCMTLAAFELELVSDAPVVLTGAYTLHPRETVMFRLTPRT